MGGPKAISQVKLVRPEAASAIDGLQKFQGRSQSNWFYARTGYTGEDGLEIMVPEAEVAAFWQSLLEAGMNLYGNDMDETISPLQAAMGWTIVLKPATRDFIGREALETEKTTGVATKLVGLVLEGRGIMRSHQKVLVDLGNGEQAEGEVTSGTFSPTLQNSIAMARVPAATGDTCHVDIRGKQVPARVIKLPFVRDGKKVYE